MSIKDALEKSLEQHGLSDAQFSELMIRLLDYGVLCRDESRKEAELYDRYLQIPELVEDYLAVLQVRLQHEPRFCSLRLFPPGASVPGLADSEASTQSGLRERLSQQEVALILVLRAEYDKALREGQIDADGQVTLPMEAISLACRNLLNRPLPESRSERGALLRRMRQLRLIRSAGDVAPEDAEGWLIIRPGITSLVTDEVLAQLLADDAPSQAADPRPANNSDSDVANNLSTNSRDTSPHATPLVEKPTTHDNTPKDVDSAVDNPVEKTNNSNNVSNLTQDCASAAARDDSHA